jgi:AcrR family transcriptional regulator
MSPAPRSSSPPQRRKRRTSSEARAEILDAAEARLRDGGPEAVRLQDIASDVGISHPTILHHFENRDGLVRALGLRITEHLVSDLLEALADRPAEPRTADDLIEHVFRTLHDSGTARLLAWQALSAPPAEGTQALLRELSEALHRRRTARARAEGRPVPSAEDSLFVTRLAGVAALGDALGGEVWQIAGDRGENLRFQRWFARLLVAHLDDA